jgi:hypothetical protein
MTVGFPLALPSSPSNFAAARFGLRRNSAIHMSPWTFAQQVGDPGGALWMAEFVVPPITSAADAAEWKAWLLKLRGIYGTFRAGDPAYSGPRGTAGGTPLVNGAHSAGVRALVTDGWSAGATFLTGDYFQIGDSLYQMVEDVTANGSGQATLVFEPTLRVALADNTAITKTAPKGLWRLASNDEAMWDETVGPIHGFSFKAHEAISV